MSPRPYHRVDADDSTLDDINTRLDRLEADARAVLDAGGEVALRMRLVRLLGEPSAPSGAAGAPKNQRRRAGRARVGGTP